MAYEFVKTDINSIFHIVKEHSNKLSCPWDSFIEENLFKNDTYMICSSGKIIGYANINKNILFSFYITQTHYRYAPGILADCIKIFKVKTAYVQTSDPLFTNLLTEWEYKIKEKIGCFFIDNKETQKPEIKAESFKFFEAKIEDIEKIVSHTGDFFDNLRERIIDKTIFLLENNGELLGCGIAEVGKIDKNYVSIGMITCKQHRKKGVAGMILWNLKQWAYSRNLQPIAGCWYYNTVSRKSLEALDMICTGKCIAVKLKGKKFLLPLTGNPPGEKV